MMYNKVTLGSFGLALSLMVSCAPSVTNIDRTQPNALDKAQFEGIWYYRGTVIDSEVEAGPTEGITSNMDKIRWDITEGMLIGYRSYEYLPYAEGLTDEGRDFFGSPVVAYAIQSHFDIQRDYNTTTGVENSVIVENTTDRPWYKRQYIRVDWTTNMVGTQTRFWTGWSNYPDAAFSGAALAKYYVQGHEETNEHRPIFTENYFDVTNIYSISPSTYFCVYQLMFNFVPRCGAGNVKVRLSFKKVDPTNDYESLYYPDNVELKDDAGNALVLNFDGRGCDDRYDPADCTVQTYPYDEAFGNFRTMRVAFDRERYLTRSGRVYMAGRFNLWEDSFNDADGSLIPMGDRTPKPIVYWGNIGFPQDMIEPAHRIATAWNEPFSDVVAFHKGYMDANGRPDIARLRNEMGEDMYQFKENSCNVENIKTYASENELVDVVESVAGSLDRVAVGNVAKVCAAVQYAELQNGATLDPAVAERTGAPMAFTWQRKGDLRFSFQNYIYERQTGGPWGVAQFGQDPETGEFSSNTGNYFGTAGDAISQREVDRIQWLNGDLSEEELFRGDQTREAISRRAAKNGNIRNAVRQMLTEQEDELREESGDGMFREGIAGEEDERWRSMMTGSDFERENLITDDILRSFAGPTMYQPFGAIPGAGFEGESGLDIVPGDVTDDALAAASPGNWGMTPSTNPFMKAAYDLGRGGYDMAAFFSIETSGLADFFKGEERDTINQFLRKEMFAAVNAHEVGHTVGLRHNFNASIDPLNYKPEFWWLEDEGTVTQFWNNPPTEENPNRGPEYKYASIMDYGFGVSLEGIHGIGEYDKAAIRFQYGQIQDVWDSSKVSLPDPRKYGSFARRCGHDSDFWGMPSLMSWMAPEYIPSIFGTAAADQTNCAGNYDVDDSCDSPVDGLYRELVVRVEAAAARNNLPSSCALFLSDINWLMTEIKKIEPNARNVYDARTMMKVDDLISQRVEVITNPPEYDNASTSSDESADLFDDDGDGVPDDKGYDWANYVYTVDYGYCSDLYAQFSNPYCQRWDTGWDLVESTEQHINAYDRDYVFNSFRRDREQGTMNPRSYMARLQSRRFFHMTNVFRYALFTRRSAFEADLFADWQAAALKGVNFLERVIQTPEPGRYCLNATTNIYELDLNGNQDPCAEPYEVGLGYGEGKFLNSSWTDEYYYKANRVGAFYDKFAAMAQMTTSSGRFVRDFSDLFNRRAFSLGYLRVYQDPMLQRFSALIRGDHEGYRSHVIEDADGEKFVRYMPLFDEELEDGSSVRQMLETYPAIEPAWSYSLRLWAMSYMLVNWSSVNDYALEAYRMTKISIRGTPEDVDYPATMSVVEFTDPESLITYRAPIIEPIAPGGLISEFPAYYGDRVSRSQGRFHEWGVGGELLKDANTYLNDTWLPAKATCEGGGDCSAFEAARTELSEKVGFIDQVRRLSYFFEFFGQN